MKTRQFLFALSFGALLLPGCKKEKEDTPDPVAPTPSVAEMVRAHTWRSVAFKNKGVQKTSWCWLNSTYTYDPSGTLLLKQGENFGACGGPQAGTVSSHPYIITSDGKYIVQDGVNALPSDSFEVVSVTSEVLKTRRWVNQHTDLWEDTFIAE